jgi:hypothetical protein
VHLYLADMAHFGAANAAYCRHLPQLNPPSRACVQVTGVWGLGSVCMCVYFVGVVGGVGGGELRLRALL